MLGRIAEISVLVRLLQETAAGRGGGVLVVGEPGIGRTHLLHKALTLDAVARAVLVTGSVTESRLPGAGLHQVVQALRDQLPRVPAAQRDPLERLLATGRLGPDGADQPPAAAMLGLLGVAAACRPLLLAVDDAHLLDPPSLDALLFVGRRIASEPIALLLTAIRRHTSETFRGWPAVSGVPELRLGPLDPTDARTLLRSSAPHPLRRHVAERLLAVAEGNPLALTELPVPLTAAQCDGRQPLGDPPVPTDRLRLRLLPELDPLPATARAALLVPAVAGQIPAAELACALKRLGHAPDALVPAEEHGVLAEQQGRVVFRDERLRLVVHHAAGAARRHVVHQALVCTLSGPAAARHLAAVAPGPGPAVADALEAAARAVAGVDPGDSAELYERAASFTPNDEDAARLLGLAAASRQQAGTPDHVPALLDRALALAHTPELRCELLILLARHQGRAVSPLATHRLLRATAVRLSADQPSRAAELLLEAAECAVRAADSRAALGSAWQAYRLTRPRGGDLAESAAVQLARVLALRGQSVQARELLLLPPAGASAVTIVARAEVLGWLEEYEAALTLLSRLLDGRPQDRVRADAPLRAAALGSRAWIRMWTGDWPGARADVTEAAGCAGRARAVSPLAQSLVLLGRLEAAQGRSVECGIALARATRVARDHGLDLVLGQVAATEGLLAMGGGSYEKAVTCYERARSLADGAGIEHPSVAPWAANLIEAYLRTGRTAEAESELARHEDGVRRSGLSWAAARGARCRALLLETGRFGHGAVEAAFQEAFENHARGRVVFEHARTLLCHGQWLRREGRSAEARRSLSRALTVFTDLGAAPWSKAAHSELRATGMRKPRRGGGTTGEPARERLTEQERRIAGLVAEGATNKEAAAALFLSPKTVEFHLGNVYRKLGVRSRSQLARSFRPAQA
ncbi:helix-turn-helix transcriptional regulator [Streptomyces chartreusis]|uniref:helix-turn-helix transcriptional regulator n=1 Tax=Streptomyces chartreusis TaxID=1969 RepID=UPI00142EE938|nr:LuxR family transcriptional regulator [Streptomyces chartreusis]GGW91411.1 transcriptional regulator [Streptomyces chartreusis]